MRIVIQCAGSKKPAAGHMKAPDGQPVSFVAHPGLAPPDATTLYAAPDAVTAQGTWRDLVVAYNSTGGANPLGLLPAYELYENQVYRQLVQHFGMTKVFILSAGWGLLSSEFLTPTYDITFSSSAAAHVRRSKRDVYSDLMLLDLKSDEPIIFLGGKDYLPLFARLTEGATALRTVYFNSGNAPAVHGCALRRFTTRTRTNWHYECARSLISGELSL